MCRVWPNPGTRSWPFVRKFSPNFPPSCPPPPSSLLSPLFLSNWFGLFEKILPLVIENSLILDLLERSNFADSLYFEKKKKNREDL